MQNTVVTIAPNSGQKPILRVAAYCRVSSDSTDQLHSFSAQVRHYARAIEENERMELADIYADATVIIGLKQNPTHGRRFSPVFFA